MMQQICLLQHVSCNIDIPLKLPPPIACRRYQRDGYMIEPAVDFNHRAGCACAAVGACARTCLCQRPHLLQFTESTEFRF